MRISDWSSDVCSSELQLDGALEAAASAAVSRPVECRLEFRHGIVGRVAEQAAVVHLRRPHQAVRVQQPHRVHAILHPFEALDHAVAEHRAVKLRAHEAVAVLRSDEHTSELQSLMRISYAVFCLK